jgi:hypothetical protein
MFVSLYPLALAGSFIYRVLQVLLYSLAGLLLVRAFGARMSYGAILNVTAVAIMPAVIVKCLLMALSITLPFAWLLLFAISMGFLAFAIKVCAPAETPAVGAPIAEPPAV